MWVVKLGGSLGRDPRLKSWLKFLARPGWCKVVVPGGGAFADQVRESQSRWRFDDRTAHRMAILAMQQYGWMLAGIQPALIPVSRAAVVRSRLRYRRPVLWLPDFDELERARIPNRWSVTSDSLAAWLARRLNADGVVLVKAAPIVTQRIDRLQRQGIVDAAFHRWLGDERRCRVFSVADLPRFKDWIRRSI